MAPNCLNKKEHDRDCFDCKWFNACDNLHTDDYFQYNPLCFGKDLGYHDGGLCIHCAQPSPESRPDWIRHDDY